jgi:hypothetical protein
MNAYHYLFKFIVIGDSGSYWFRLRRGKVLRSTAIH